MRYGLKPWDSSNGQGAGDNQNYGGSDQGNTPWWVVNVAPHKTTTTAPEHTILDTADVYGDGTASKAGGNGAGSSSGSTSTSTTTASPTAGFTIDINWDSSVSSAPAGFASTVMSAISYLESVFTNPITVTLDVGYGEIDGSALSSDSLGESEAYLDSYSYSTIRGALASSATSAAQQSAVASLPATAPVSGTFWTTSAEAKALGLAGGTGLDGYVGFSSSLPFTYNGSSSVSSGTYDLYDVVLHEVSEIMGRMTFDGETLGSYANSYSLLDMFHYSAPGVRDFSAGTAGYFSDNGGVTNLGAFNTVAGGDPGDWASSMGNDSFDAYSNSGVVNSVSSGDLTEMNVLGWTLAGSSTPASPPPPPPPASTSQPTGISVALLTGASSVGKISQVGGSTSDTYTYTLGGAAASSFTLTTAGNAASLATKSSLAGSLSGQLYALTITATDTTSGKSTAAIPVDVIQGAAGNDTINIATISSAIGVGTPTFVYGGSGADHITGAGMTGALWIDGGAGADAMTGGSGSNHYVYTAASDSTVSAMDVIANFSSSRDFIDLALGKTFKIAGALGNGKLAADSIGWQSSGGNTFILVNTGSSPEALTATNMKIELQGAVSLTSNNFVFH